MVFFFVFFFLDVIFIEKIWKNSQKCISSVQITMIFFGFFRWKLRPGKIFEIFNEFLGYVSNLWLTSNSISFLYFLPLYRLVQVKLSKSLGKGSKNAKNRVFKRFLRVYGDSAHCSIFILSKIDSATPKTPYHTVS